jgi:hypothetical protein
MIEAELADGRVLEFPDGTDPNVIQATVKKMIGPQERPSPSLGDRVNALQGGLYRGAAGLAGLPMDTVENVYNLTKAGVGTVATAAGRPDLAPNLTKGTPLGSEWIANKMQGVGINTQNPRPDDTASRMLYTGGVIGGGSMVPGAALKPTLAAGAGGAVAGEISDNPLAPALGAMAPAAASQAVRAARQPLAARTRENAQAFREAGAEPSVGQATGIPFFQGLENRMSKFPGGTGVMKGFFERQQQLLGSKAKTGVSGEDAGRAIESGVRGGFLARTKQQWSELDQKLSSTMPKDFAVEPTHSLRVLDELTAPTPGAEATTAPLVNPKIKQMRDGLAKDLSGSASSDVRQSWADFGKPTRLPGVVPFEALRDLRSRVGAMLDDALTTDIPRGELKRVYGALSEDMKAAATAAGPEAVRLFNRQNNFWSARQQRVDSVLDKVIGKGRQPEDIFSAVAPKDPNQANKLRGVMRSLLPEERQIVTDAVVNRLGRATPGRQDEFGEVFSSNTFLTNWNKLSPGAKDQLFSDPVMRKNLESIAKAAATIREGAGVASNPSGTAGSFAAYSIYSSPIVSAATGSAWPMLAAGGAMGAANIGARMLTNKKIVDWLANAPKPTAQNVGMHLARLSVLYNQSDEETKKELGAYMQSVGQ